MLFFYWKSIIMDVQTSQKFTFGEPELVWDGKWLKYYSIPYTTQNGGTGAWEMCGKSPLADSETTIFIYL